MHGFSQPFSSHYPYGGPHAFPGAYHHMYAGYPHPPPHFVSGHHPFYPTYPPHLHAMSAHYRAYNKHALPESQQRPGATKSMGMAPVTPSDTEKPARDKAQPASASLVAGNNAIKSVADWQQAALSTGKPPSAGRCLPLKEPIPSRYWG